MCPYCRMGQGSFGGTRRAPMRNGRRPCDRRPFVLARESECRATGYGLPKPYLSSTAMPSGPVTNLMNAAAVALSLEPDRTAMG